MSKPDNELTRPLTKREADLAILNFEAGMKRILQAKPMPAMPKKKAMPTAKKKQP